jgi:hypothetical protein
MPGLGGAQQRGRRGLASAVAARSGSQASAARKAGAAPGAGAARKKQRFNPYKVLGDLETNQLLTGKDLRQAARALAAIETRTQTGGYRRLSKELHSERESEAEGLGRLGTTLQRQVGSVYRGIADSEAQALANQQALAGQLNQTSAQIAQEGQAALDATQNTQLGGVTDALALRGAPGGGTAQQELAAAVAAQDARQSANSQASQQFAAQQGAGYGQLAAMQARSTQMQGGAAVGGIGQTVIGRVAKSNREYGQDIREARSKLAEARANKGLLFTKNLLELRGAEQKYALGKAAVRGEREAQDLAEDKFKEEQRQNKAENNQWAREFGLKQWEARHPEASDDERREKREEIRQDQREIKSVIPTAVAAAKGSPAANNFEAYVAYVNTKTSAPPQLVRKVLKDWWKKKQKIPITPSERNRPSTQDRPTTPPGG